MSWKEMKKAVNSTVGTNNFKSLDKIMEDLLAPNDTLNVGANGEYDVKKYGYVNVSVATSAEAPTITITNSTGVIKATSSGLTSTKQLTTKAAATIIPSTANQTISAYRWLTGIQTVKGDTNLVGSNIVSGKTIFGVAGTYNPIDNGYLKASVANVGLEFYIAAKIYGTWVNNGTVTYSAESFNDTATLDLSFLSGSIFLIRSSDDTTPMDITVSGSIEIMKYTTDKTSYDLRVYGDGTITVQ